MAIHKFVRISDETLPAWGAALCAMVSESGFRPSLIVAIPSGGVHVAAAMRADMGDIPVLHVDARRPTTSAKSGNPVLRNAAKSLPRHVQHGLRIMELHLVTKRLTAPRVATIRDDAIASLRRYDAQDILIVDDTVDTGGSLRAVKDLVEEMVPTADVRCAVLAATLEDPACVPEYVLEPRALVQGPWSLDAAG